MSDIINGIKETKEDIIETKAELQRLKAELERVKEAIKLYEGILLNLPNEEKSLTQSQLNNLEEEKKDLWQEKKDLNSRLLKLQDTLNLYLSKSNTLESLGTSLKKVSFNVLRTINVKHWQRAEIKKLTLPQFLTGDEFLFSFQLTIKDEFVNEIGDSEFQLYVLPHKFTDINVRQRVESYEDLERFLLDYMNINEQPQLYVWNVEGKGTPDKEPKNIEDASKPSNSSQATRTTTQKLCRERDGNRCIFCDYNDTSQRDACHILELKDYNNASNDEQIHLLVTCNIENPSSIRNLISLCKKCHRNFDNYCLCIHPETRILLVSDNILNEQTQGGTSYASIKDMTIEFNGILQHQPTKELLIYRYEYYLKKQNEDIPLPIADILLDLDINNED